MRKMFKNHRQFKTIIAVVFSVIFLSNFASYAQYNKLTNDIYHLINGTEYIDKTFVYNVLGESDTYEYKAMCAEMNSPTYDVKKGLMTWIDYYQYELEEVFTVDVANHVRQIINYAGPHLDHETVIKKIESDIGIVDLTYDEVISAVQYAIWFFTDGDFRIPSTANGEDLYRYLVTLPGESAAVVDKNVISAAVDSVERDEENGVIRFSYHYSSSKANTRHSYSVDIVSLYGADETKSTNGNRTDIVVEIPITTNEMHVSFDVRVDGSLSAVSEVVAFSPDDEDNDVDAQMLVAYKAYSNSVSATRKTLSMNYDAYELTLDDDGDITRNGFTDGTVVSYETINDINPVGKDGYEFEGWFAENNGRITTSVVMDRNRTLHTIYSKEDANDDDDPDDTDDNDDDDDDNNNNGNDDDDTPDDTDDTTTINDDDTPSEPDNQNISRYEEEEDIPDDETPEEGPGGALDWMPKTGGISLLVFLGVGGIAILVGLYLKRGQAPHDGK